MSFYSPEPAAVTVEVGDLETAEGQVIFMLFDQAEGFPREPNKALKSGKVKAQGTTVTYTFEQVPYGNYAIAVFHDENGDGAIERNFIGIPKERVAATNMTGMGRPGFQKCSMTVNQPTVRYTLKFIN